MNPFLILGAVSLFAVSLFTGNEKPDVLLTDNLVTDPNEPEPKKKSKKKKD